jgi:hypothetical protein
MQELCMMQWKFEYFLQNSSKFKLVELKTTKIFTQLIFKLMNFKSGNAINYTLKHEI